MVLNIYVTIKKKIFVSAELTAKGTKESIKQNNKFAATGLCNLLKLISNLQEDWKKCLSSNTKPKYPRKLKY